MNEIVKAKLDASDRRENLMKKAIIYFEKCIQDSQDFGSNDEHMISRVYFSLEIEGKKYTGLYANLKQTVGSNFETDPIEVSPPIGYDGTINYAGYRDQVEKYYRSLIGSHGSGIRIVNSSNIRMQNHTFNISRTLEFAMQE